MLGIYEKRHFAEGEKIWIGSYKNLTNVLHWHLECEIIQIVEGSAQIKIGDSCYAATKGDSFFCTSEQLHYIVGSPDSCVDVMIFNESLTKGLTDNYMMTSAKIPHCVSVNKYFAEIKKEQSQKGPFYCEKIEINVRDLIIDIFRSCQIIKQNKDNRLHKDLITRIHNEFSHITFKEAVHYSGYSASYFSKMFKKLAGMSFSEYLNIIKIENAILLLRENNNTTITSVSEKCGFSTVRNFNRVFKNITGYSPTSLPKDLIIDTELHISKTDDFDPTNITSILL